jgi:hypothetical protein
MSQSETEQERKVREYWASAYKNKNSKSSIYHIGSLDFAKDNEDELPYKPTAVLSKAPPNPNQPLTKRSIYNITSLDFTT